MSAGWRMRSEEQPRGIVPRAGVHQVVAIDIGSQGRKLRPVVKLRAKLPRPG